MRLGIHSLINDGTQARTGLKELGGCSSSSQIRMYSFFRESLSFTAGERPFAVPGKLKMLRQRDRLSWLEILRWTSKIELSFKVILRELCNEPQLFFPLCSGERFISCYSTADSHGLHYGDHAASHLDETSSCFDFTISFLWLSVWLLQEVRDLI